MFSMLDELLWTLQKYIEKPIFKETFWQPASENTYVLVLFVEAEP